MTIIFLLIPLSVTLAGLFLVAFIWAVRSGQYDDTCTPAMRLLLHDTCETVRTTSNSPSVPLASNHNAIKKESGQSGAESASKSQQCSVLQAQVKP